MEPEQVPQQPKQPPTSSAPKKNGIFVPLFLMIWPFGIFTLTLLAYALLNLFMPDQLVDGSLFAEPNPVKAALNAILFLLGASAVLFGPITFIVGLVLLIQRKSKPTNAQN